MEKPLWLCWAQKWSGKGSREIGGVTSVSQLMETQIGICLHLYSVGWMGRVQQKNNGFCQHFYLRESCPFKSPPEARQFSSSPHVPGIFQATDPVLELIK